jgi:hypothetical protein
MALSAVKSFTNISGAQGIVLNEVLANNSFIREADGTTPDWIELFNNSGSPADLSGYSLTDDTLQPRRWVVPAGVAIPPQGFLRILCDPDRPASTNALGVLNTGFGLKSTGGGVYLYDLPAKGGALLVSLSYGLQATDFSMGRVPDGTGPWGLNLPTPATANIGAALGNPSGLRLNEWMAAPASGDDWFEIYNPSAQPVALGGLYLTDDLNNRTKHPIAPLSFIGVSTNGYLEFKADGNTGAGADHTSFSLRAAGESLGLFTASGTAIDSLSFGAQLDGVSQGRFPDGTTNVVSFSGTESPGEANYRRLANVAINEALTHTDLPFEDAIELRNLTASPISIGGWWLSDSKGNLRKYRIPDDRVLPASGYAVFYEYQFNGDPQDPNSFALSSSDGDQVYLSEANAGALTGWRTSVKFGAAENGVSFGRYVTSVGQEEFVAMRSRSLGRDNPASVAEFRAGTGLANPYPKVGPVVISEFMYHPPDLGTNDNVRDEYLKLQNLTGSPVALYDPAQPANTWRLRDAVDFDFPSGASLPAGGSLVVVSFDPVLDPFTLANFRSIYGIATNVAIYGPYSGKLANSSDSIELKKPDLPDTNGVVPYIMVEQITYGDVAPWPPAADGFGSSLHRVSLEGYGNDPTNWVAAPPALGTPPSGDSDGDGMPDAWEIANGFDRTNPADAALDFDGDGSTNLGEYEAGTDPRSPYSVLALDVTGAGPTVLEFDAKSGKTYTIERSFTLLPGSWQRLIDVPAGADRRIQVTDPAVLPMRFYRLRTPQLP